MKTFSEWLKLNEAWRVVRFRQSGNKPHETTIGNVTLRLYRDSDTMEFAVRWIVNGKEDEGKSYYTDNLQDAMQTMNRMAQQLIAAPHTGDFV